MVNYMIDRNANGEYNYATHYWHFSGDLYLYLSVLSMVIIRSVADRLTSIRIQRTQN
jgi:hypothetical protein